MEAYDSAYDYGDIVEWRINKGQRTLQKTGKCDNCGGSNIKTTKKGNLYCGDLCWVENPKESFIDKLRRQIKSCQERNL